VNYYSSVLSHAEIDELANPASLVTDLSSPGTSPGTSGSSLITCNVAEMQMPVRVENTVFSTLTAMSAFLSAKENQTGWLHRGQIASDVDMVILPDGGYHHRDEL